MDACKSISNTAFFEDVHRLLRDGQSVSIRVRGSSMSPFLRDGRDCVTLSACDPTRLKKGDIVLFVYMERHLLHRIIDIRPGQYIVRGDAVTDTTERADPDHVLGKVTQVIRPGGGICRPDSFRWKCYWAVWSCTCPLVKRVVVKLWKKLPKE